MTATVRDLPNGIRCVRRPGADSDKGLWLYEAWEPVEGARYGANTRAKDGSAWGRVDTKRHPNPDGIQGSAGDRVGTLISWELEQRWRAYAAMEQAFPESADGWRSQGVIRFQGDPETVLARMQRKGEIPADAMARHAPTFAGT